MKIINETANVAVDSITTRNAIKKNDILNTLNDKNIINNKYKFILSIISKIFKKFLLIIIFIVVIK